MPSNNPEQLAHAIDWRFTLTAQTLVSRYGELGGVFYKQVLPGGIEVPARYPPRPIEARIYNLARAQHDRAARA